MADRKTGSAPKLPAACPAFPLRPLRSPSRPLRSRPLLLPVFKPLTHYPSTTYNYFPHKHPKTSMSSPQIIRNASNPFHSNKIKVPEQWHIYPTPLSIMNTEKVKQAAGTKPWRPLLYLCDLCALFLRALCVNALLLPLLVFAVILGDFSRPSLDFGDLKSRLKSCKTRL